MTSRAKFEDISIEQYSERSIVVRGDTRKYKEDLKKLGGKYNSRLRGEPGWIFPKTKEDDINSFIKGGQRIVSEKEAEEGEVRTREWASKRESERNSSSQYLSQNGNHSIGEYAILVNMLKDLAHKMEKMEQAVSILLTPDQKEELGEKIKETFKQKSYKKVIKRNNEKKKVGTHFSFESGIDENEVELEDIIISSSDEKDEKEVPTKRLLR